MRTIVISIILVLMLATGVYAWNNGNFGFDNFGAKKFGGSEFGTGGSGGSGGTYWDTPMTDRWNTPMVALWNTSMDTEIP